MKEDKKTGVKIAESPEEAKFKEHLDQAEEAHVNAQVAVKINKAIIDECKKNIKV